MWAVINSDGTIARSRMATSAGHLGTGQYEVIFPVDVTNCSYHGSLGLANGVAPVAGQIGVAGRGVNPNGVLVVTEASSGVTADWGFHLLVVCAPLVSKSPDATDARVKQLYAVVDSSATLVRGRLATGASNVGTGKYEVDFSVNVQSCSYKVTLGDTGSFFPPTGEVGVASRAGNPNAVLVETRDSSSAALAARSFHLLVLC